LITALHAGLYCCQHIRFAHWGKTLPVEEVDFVFDGLLKAFSKQEWNDPKHAVIRLLED
jgi:hypothetical protein